MRRQEPHRVEKWKFTLEIFDDYNEQQKLSKGNVSAGLRAKLQREVWPTIGDWGLVGRHKASLHCADAIRLMHLYHLP